MASIICGSLAFDTIMTFEGRFADQILADQIHNLNVSFLVPGLRRDFGGCAGNIAYGLRQLGGVALPMATLGADGGDYLQRLQDLGIATDYVRQIPDSYTAQAMIMTDQANNQITAFHPGAMMQAHVTQIAPRADVRLGIISPDGRDAMLQHAEQFAQAGIPFLFDPGQGLPMFGGAELRRFIALATWVTVNDYEARMLSERTGLTPEQMSQQVEGLVVTLGAEGSEVWVRGEKTAVAPVTPAAVVDPTGCGDAYRAALLYGLEQGWPLACCAELGSHMGALKIAQRGPQNYRVDRGALGL